MEDHDSIDIRQPSEEFKEILGNPPSWLLRHGMTTALVGFLVLVLFGYFFKYPETVSAPIKLETENPPVDIVATTIGKITPLLPEDTDITEGMIIARLEDPYGDFDAILRLDSIITFYKNNSDMLPNFAEIENWKLGPIQTDFFKFSQLMRGKTSNYSNSSGVINNFIASIQEEIVRLNNQIKLHEARLIEIPSELTKYGKVYGNSKKDSDHVILINLDRERKRINDEDIPDLKRQIAEKERQIREQQYQKSNVQKGIVSAAELKQQEIAFSLNIVENKIEEWKKSHLIEAPIDGTLYYQDKIKSKEYSVNIGQPLFAIVPPNAEDKIEGKLFLSSQESVKIEEGQSVKIKFSGFRPSEYGLLEGTILDKATIPRNGQYLVRVQLDKGMQSTKGKTISFEHQMLGNAQIITKDRRFINLIFDQFMEMWRRN